MEHLVLACDLEALHVLEGGICVVVVFQMDHDGIAFHLHILERRTLIHQSFKAVVAIQGCIGQTLTHLLLLGRMNLGKLVGIDQVVDAYQRTVGDDLGGLVLLFAQQGTTDGVDVAVIFIRCNLNEVEGNLAQAELRTPLFYQQLHALRVLVAWIAYI